jgi:TetR/AcrR family transcriptional regulator, transcriptional repressor for nem operon
VAPHDAAIGRVVAGCFAELRAFFRRNLEAARVAHQVPRQTDPDELAGHLLGVVLGIRVLARTGANRAQLDAVVRPALRLLAMPRRPRRKTSPRNRPA